MSDAALFSASELTISHGNYLYINATDADVAELTTLLRRGVRVGNESVDADAHLYELVPKPWGQEYRAYADDLLDVWHLRIDPGHSTSMHSHPRKVTYLLCLSGTGVMRTLHGEHQFGPGAVLRIGRGAFHSTLSSGDTPLSLIEVESPRNKYDLLRLRDSYDRSGQAYEQATAQHRTPPRRVPYLPNAKICRSSPCGSFAFDIVSGMDVHYRRRSAAAYLIPLGLAELLADRLEILTDHPDDQRAPRLDSYYLAIRRAA